jgi:type IV pilus assembly protein PilB
MGVEPYNFVSALNCILAQRLVRVICDSCKTEMHYQDGELEASGLVPEEWKSVRFYEGQGCIECAGTGYKGRTAIHELLDLSDNIREMILAKKPTSEIRRAAQSEGMRFLRQAALDKVRHGYTTLREINKVTFIEAMR